ncbi:MarR family winged helix-turn-helix transcriptional regulator [Breznakiella homolactica]|uniref:MarR family transcriptional regulator n=1 Tax=Breznakiella homolactica TaxID=2798577 RepID=A0A7T7XLX1_9SPIR|nr:MarR family transcriptional regulator [Breznakiella homolactica]QQO08682.1 MarR family transcriptional regulator [Breznakiella homolactica]
MTKSEDIGFQIKLINDLLTKKANQNLEKYGLTISQFQVLHFLHQRKRLKTSPKDLEVFFEVSSPTMSGILKRLETKGFVTTEFDNKDRRVKHVYLTTKERRLFYYMKSSRKDTENVITRGITEAEQEQLKSLLGRVYDNINSF